MWRVEMCVEGGKIIKINKRVSTFIREMRVDLIITKRLKTPYLVKISKSK